MKFCVKEESIMGLIYLESQWREIEQQRTLGHSVKKLAEMYHVPPRYLYKNLLKRKKRRNARLSKAENTNLSNTNQE